MKTGVMGQKEANQSVKIFKPVNPWKLGCSILAGLLILFGLLPFVMLILVPDVKGDPFGYFVYLLFIAWGVSTVFGVNRQRLVTTPDGIEYRHPFFIVQSTWENVSRVSLTSSRILMHLHVSGLRHNRGVLKYLPIIGKNGKVIPLYWFLKEKGQRRWKNDELLDLGKYIPHLFKTEREPDQDMTRIKDPMAGQGCAR